MGCSVNTIFINCQTVHKNRQTKAFDRNSPQGISFCGTVPPYLEVSIGFIRKIQVS